MFLNLHHHVMFLQYCKWQSPHRPKSSFLPRLTASVIFFLQNFTNWRKMPNVKSFIVWRCQVVKDFFSTFLRHQTSYNPPNFSSLSLVLCFERSKRKRAFPKALRWAQSGVRGKTFSWESLKVINCNEASFTFCDKVFSVKLHLFTFFII